MGSPQALKRVVMFLSKQSVGHYFKPSKIHLWPRVITKNIKYPDNLIIQCVQATEQMLVSGGWGGGSIFYFLRGHKCISYLVWVIYTVANAQRYNPISPSYK